MPMRSGFVSSYLDPIALDRLLDDVAGAHSDLCRWELLPHLSHGYQGARLEARGQHPMRVLRITAPGGSARPAVLLMRSQHAREWIGGMAIAETVMQLLENYRQFDTDPLVQRVVRCLQAVEVLVIPDSNPDGTRLSFFDAGRRMWRKNLRPADSPGKCAGVDCNRNFPRYFGEAGSSSDPCAETYHGPRALSEPETANVAHLAQAERRLVFAIDCHSYGQALFRPSPQGGTFTSSEPVTAADDAVYVHLETELNRDIRRVQGVTYSTGTTSNHAGTTDEYLHFEHGIFTFDLECARDFQPAIADAIRAAHEVAAATLALASCATGETGLDVQALIAARPVPTTDAPLPSKLPAERAWQPRPLPPDRWRRFRVRCASLSGLASDSGSLTERGFEVIPDHGTSSQLLVSEFELEELRRLGFQPTVEADLYAAAQVE